MPPGNHSQKQKVKGLPVRQSLKKDLGVPKFAFRNKGQDVISSAVGYLDQASVPLEEPSNVGFSRPDASLGRVDSSAKAYMKEFRKVLDLADVVIQVLDARDPLGCRSKLVENEVTQRAAEGKRLILVINKIDLVPRANVEAWLKYLRHDYPTVAFKSSTQQQRTNLSQREGGIASRGSKSDCLGADSVIQLLKNYSRSLNMKTSVTVGVVGYPNVGKSSLINSLKRARVCGVAATPGHTKVAQEIILDKNVKLLDCPGIVFADGSDSSRAADDAALARTRSEILLRNAVKIELVEDPITPVEVILSRCTPEYIQGLYSIPRYDTAQDFLIILALSRGRLGKGGKPDLDATARSVLRDWNGGKISYQTEPPAIHPSSLPTHDAPEMASSSTTTATDVGRAEIMREWGVEFDLAGLLGEADKEALDGLTLEPTRDEPMDETSENHKPNKLFGSGLSHKRDRSPSDDPMDEVAAAQRQSEASARPIKRAKLKLARASHVDAHELATLASANPLSRSRLRKDRRNGKKSEQREMKTGAGLADQISRLEMHESRDGYNIAINEQR